MTKKLDRKRILDFIDRGQWKHSWHLPKRTPGPHHAPGIDWYNPQTREALLGILERERARAIKVANEAQELIEMVEAMEVDEEAA